MICGVTGAPVWWAALLNTIETLWCWQTVSLLVVLNGYTISMQPFRHLQSGLLISFLLMVSTFLKTHIQKFRRLSRFSLFEETQCAAHCIVLFSDFIVILGFFFYGELQPIFHQLSFLELVVDVVFDLTSKFCKLKKVKCSIHLFICFDVLLSPKMLFIYLFCFLNH